MYTCEIHKRKYRKSCVECWTEMKKSEADREQALKNKRDVHPCKGCIWAKWQESVVTCPFPRCVKDHGFIAGKESVIRATAQKYSLITAPDAEGARRIAQSKGFGARDWLFIPLDEKNRRSMLDGKHGFTRERLIGSFTVEEIAQLTARS